MNGMAAHQEGTVMSRTQRIRVMLGATVMAITGLLLSVGGVLASGANGPFPR